MVWSPICLTSSCWDLWSFSSPDISYGDLELIPVFFRGPTWHPLLASLPLSVAPSALREAPSSRAELLCHKASTSVTARSRTRNQLCRTSDVMCEERVAWLLGVCLLVDCFTGTRTPGTVSAALSGHPGCSLKSGCSTCGRRTSCVSTAWKLVRNRVVRPQTPDPLSQSLSLNTEAYEVWTEVQATPVFHPGLRVQSPTCLRRFF